MKIEFSKLRVTFLFLLSLLVTGGTVVGQISPDRKLTWSDKKVMRIISKKYSIDKTTFRNITPDKDAPYWINSLRRYQAMNKNWIVCDPPGPPMVFFITRFNKVFGTMTAALTSIHYTPENDKDALKIAVMIAEASSPYEAVVITKSNNGIKGIPNSILNSQVLTPSVKTNSNGYVITVFSYVARKTKNRFVRGYHTLWEHRISIEHDAYREKITIAYEKRD